MTYFGVDTQEETDPVKRKAFETMIKTYGQTPRQLFTNPHPAKLKSDIEKIKTQENSDEKVFEPVNGLKWGIW